MLQVGVDDGDNGRIGQGQPLGEGPRQAANPIGGGTVVEADGMAGGRRGPNGVRGVVIGVIDEEQLPADRLSVEMAGHPVDQLGDVRGLVATGHHDGQRSARRHRPKLPRQPRGAHVRDRRQVVLALVWLRVPRSAIGRLYGPDP